LPRKSEQQDSCRSQSRGRSKRSIVREGCDGETVSLCHAGIHQEDEAARAQFGKNHPGDRNEFLPTAHGFDEWFGNLYGPHPTQRRKERQGGLTSARPTPTYDQVPQVRNRAAGCPACGSFSLYCICANLPQAGQPAARFRRCPPGLVSPYLRIDITKLPTL
jgi:hypothetical protein